MVPRTYPKLIPRQYALFYFRPNRFDVFILLRHNPRNDYYYYYRSQESSWKYEGRRIIEESRTLNQSSGFPSRSLGE